MTTAQRDANNDAWETYQEAKKPFQLEDITEPVSSPCGLVIDGEPGLRINSAAASQLVLEHRIRYRRMDGAPRQRAALGPINRGDVVIDDAEWRPVFDESSHATVVLSEQANIAFRMSTRPQTTVEVAWTEHCTIGDPLVMGQQALGVVDEIIDDGHADARVYLPEGVGGAHGVTAIITRTVRTAKRRMGACARASRYGLARFLTEPPSVHARQLEYMRDTGLRALAGDFVGYKAIDGHLRERAYQRFARQQACADPWSVLKALARRERTSTPRSDLPLEIFNLFQPDPRSAALRDLEFLTASCGLRISVNYAARTLGVRLDHRDVTAISSGAVTSPSAYDLKKGLPTRDGLQSETVFGALKDFECRCGALSGRKFSGTSCATCGVTLGRSARLRAENQGHIALPCAVVPYYHQPVVATALGLEVAQLLQLVAEDGGTEARRRLTSMSVENVPVAIRSTVLARELTGDEQGLSWLLWNAVPVLPPNRRFGLDARYTQILWRCSRILAFQSYSSPGSDQLQQARRLLQEAVDELLVGASVPMADPLESPSVLSLMRGIAGRRRWQVDMSCVATLLVDHRSTGRCCVPAALLEEAALPRLVTYLHSNVFDLVGRGAAERRLLDDPVLRRSLLERFLEERPVIVAAADDTGSGRVIAMHAVATDEPVIRLPPREAETLGLSRGAAVAIHIPVSTSALKDARALATRGDHDHVPSSASSCSWTQDVADAGFTRIAAERLRRAVLHEEEDTSESIASLAILGGYDVRRRTAR